jgi:signal transduction histidine kinase
MLMTAAQKIGERNLDFSIDYHSKNEIGKLCDAFTNMREELKRSLSAQWKIEQERTEMVEALAHDLKTPMSVIQGYAEALLNSAPTDRDKHRKYLSVIRENAKRASDLVRKMQYSSELEIYGMELNLREVNIKHFLEQKAKDYELQAKQKRIQIVSDFAGVPGGLRRIDPEKLERVLDNIVNNSLQYTPDGGSITITAKEEQEEIRFEISDSGPGFNPQDLPKIFEKFYRSDSARRSAQGNSGLGLYICKQLIEKLGGSIQASNCDPLGAKIAFTIKTSA